MEGKHAKSSTYEMPIKDNQSLSQLIEVIEVSIGHAHSILHSIEDISRLPKAASPGLRTRDSGYSEAGWPNNGDDLGRRLLSLEGKVEENRTYLKDLQKANLRGLQVIVEDPEDIVVKELHSKIKVNFEASKELRRLAEHSPSLSQLNTTDLEDALPPVVNIKSLDNRLLQVLNNWNLPFPQNHGKLSLCNSAKLLNSGRNTGILEHAQLRDADKQVIKRNGGSFQFWKCSICDFRVRYHATQCNSSQLETTDETRRPGRGYLTLRTAFLAKSHLHRQKGQVFKYACLFCLGNGKRLHANRTAFTKEDELADHIDECHDAASLPQVFMKKLYVAAPDEQPEGRCDIQFHRTQSAV